MIKKILITAIVFGLISIVLGAFAAHGLKKELSPEALQSFNIGVKYQMYHALFLLFLATTNSVSETVKKNVYYAVFIGVILFSFSIYLLVTTSITGINFKSIGFVTPIGGLFLILAWSILLISFLKNKSI